MTDDIIERAEAWRDRGLGSDPVSELIAALKDAQAENERLQDQFKTYVRHAEAEIERLRNSLQYTPPKAWDGKEPWPGDAVREAWK